jgi:hypothetical protein
MGMFTNDILFGGARLDQEFTIGNVDNRDGGEPFVLLDCKVLSDAVPTSIGDATKTVLRVVRIDPDSYKVKGPVFDVGTFSMAIAEKAKSKAEGDLPAVVRCHMVPSQTKGNNDALVLSFISAYDGAPIESEAL